MLVLRQMMVMIVQSGCRVKAFKSWIKDKVWASIKRLANLAKQWTKMKKMKRMASDQNPTKLFRIIIWNWLDLTTLTLLPSSPSLICLGDIHSHLFNKRIWTIWKHRWNLSCGKRDPCCGFGLRRWLAMVAGGFAFVSRCLACHQPPTVLTQTSPDRFCWGGVTSFFCFMF